MVESIRARFIGGPWDGEELTLMRAYPQLATAVRWQPDPPSVVDPDPLPEGVFWLESYHVPPTRELWKMVRYRTDDTGTDPVVYRTEEE